MKRLSISIAVAVLILSTGCAVNHGWRHDTIVASKWDEDYTDCAFEAESLAMGLIGGTASGTVAKGYGHSAVLIREGEMRYFIEKCMAEKGYFQ
jgi:hypothetical protein